jgi:hypothetical protein
VGVYQFDRGERKVEPDHLESIIEIEREVEAWSKSSKEEKIVQVGGVKDVSIIKP